MPDTTRIREPLRAFDFSKLFIEELGWDRHTSQLEVPVDGQVFALNAVAQKRGMVVYVCDPLPDGSTPDHATRRKVERQVSKSVLEHLILYVDKQKTAQVWQWVKREAGKPTACREHTYHRNQPGDALIQKLQAIAFSLAEEESLSLVDVTRRTRKAFDVERITKRFYDEFRKQHAAFLKFITGIPVKEDHEWYASVMLNRLMFIYFIQRKGFLDGDHDYLRIRLERTKREHGKDKFYSFYRYFLLRLFHEGLGGRARNPDLDKLLGRIPYLNGGLFDVHELEKPDRYGNAIQIPDEAFEAIFDYFDGWQWHLDERPLRSDKEINPGVLGFIFEKYINQKQMGAYYTEEDITDYISKNTVIPFLFDAARPKCKIAFENPNGPTIWDLLKSDPERYIYPALLRGKDKTLPANIAVGLNDVSQRVSWNKPARTEFALPTEIWREVVARRKRCDELLAKLAGGEVRDINDLITLNLNIRQFAQDVI
ncbi:MAG: SAM-dependent methyltransferase, partial [Deltaproteobacteria bacterium]|nr:SAM-dependent methyltransferase [Deltaproteobacteria bacterium]